MTISDYPPAHSQPPLSHWPNIIQQREKRALGKVTGVRRGWSLRKSTYIYNIEVKQTSKDDNVQ